MIKRGKIKLIFVKIGILLLFSLIFQTEISASLNDDTSASWGGGGGRIRSIGQINEISDNSFTRTIPKDKSREIIPNVENNNSLKYDQKILEEFNQINKTEIRVIVRLKDNSDTEIIVTKEKRAELMQKIEDVLSILNENEFKLIRRFSDGFAGPITKEGFNKLVSDPRIKFINLDLVGSVSLDDSIPLINADDVHNLGLNGTGIKVCIIDTGVNASHIYLTGKISNQYCYCSITNLGSGGCCPDNTDEDISAKDDHGHGTHVVGIVASQNSTYKGVAPGANISVIKVTNSSGNFLFSDLGSAIDKCRLWNMDIISMSLGDGQNHPGISSCSNTINTEINSAYGQNIFLTSASGNEYYTNGINYPACSPNVTSVGASTKSDTLASFTNRGSGLLDLLAPGQSIISLKWDPNLNNPSCAGSGNFMSCSGTSQATPHVAGAVALLLQKNSTLTPAQIKSILISNGDNVDGYPRLNVLAAINSLDVGTNGTTSGIQYNCTETGYDQCIGFTFGDCNVSLAVNHYTNVNNISWGAVNDSSDPYVINNYISGWKTVKAKQIYYDVDSPENNGCYKGGCEGYKLASTNTKVTTTAPGIAFRENIVGYNDTTNYWCWAGFNEFGPNYGANNPIYVLNCFDNNDCQTGYYCNKNSSWFDWHCVLKKGDAQNCTSNSECSSGYCDNDGIGLADDGWCFTPYNTYFDGQEKKYCEISTGFGNVDCDEREVGEGGCTPSCQISLSAPQNPTMLHPNGGEIFNTSSISSTATIDDVVLNLTFTSLGSSNCDINQIEKKPSSATDQNLYNDIGNGTSYINNNNFCVTGSSYYPSLDLGNSANTDLQNLLSAKWFGVGIKWDTEYPYSGTLAYSYSSEGTNDPILIVKYTV